MKNPVFILIICLIFSAQTFIFAKGAGTTVQPVLKLGVGPRGLALGQAYSTLANDVSSIYWNPAGLVQLKTPWEIMAMHSEWFFDSRYEYLGFANQLDAFSAFGVSGLFFYSTLDRRNETGSLIDSYLVGNLVISAAYARKIYLDFLPDLSLGISVKYTTENLDDFRDQTSSCDIGIRFNISDIKGLKASVVFQNLGITLAGPVEPLPSLVKVGVAYNFNLNNDDNNIFKRSTVKKSGRGKGSSTKDYWAEVHEFNVAVEASYRFDESYGFNFGAEYQPWTLLLIRAGGYITGSVFIPTAGIGLEYENFRLDYAIMNHQDLGITHRPSISFCF